MSTDFEDLVETLKRSVAVPGTFAAVFPETTDEDLIGSLLDGFGEAQLNGFLATYVADDDGLVTPGLTRAQQSLVVLFSTIRILRSELRNRKVHTRYEARGAVAEVDQYGPVLVQLLKGYEAEKALVLDNARWAGYTTAFAMADLYVDRVMYHEIPQMYAQLSYPQTVMW